MTARNWREIPQRYRLEAGKCKKCSEVLYPPRVVCPRCGGRTFESFRLSGEGEVLTYSIVHVAPRGFEDDVPFVVAIVGMKEGVQMTGQIVDCDHGKLAIGMKVRTEFRRIQEDGEAGMIFYGHKFVPAAA
ncbi:MAG: Zn-ribbon domain-containing OB-fold protein [Candidatus Riflebacteria bacterium]|nr:Zn-ribbon domain-containing OB-fold protein [Candidatus Riflebacteria bacterium]